GNVDVTITQSLAITDPGEQDREKQSFVDRIVVQISNVVAWIFPLLILAICTQVIIRKAGFNQAWLDDAQWWLYGFAMTVGFAYAITTQSHVRVDILHQNFSPSKKAWIELFGLGWLLLPFLILMTDVLFHYALASVIAGEGSDSPNGLHRLYLLKMSLPVIFLLAICGTTSMFIRHLSTVRPIYLWTVLIGMFPAAWFLFERAIFYCLWWIVRLSNPELNPRRVIREPIMDFTILYGLAALIVVIGVSYFLTRRKSGA
ncbi:MAG: TRAP transporter small permease subunit, partial [Pseudomonadota bacterium]